MKKSGTATTKGGAAPQMQPRGSMAPAHNAMPRKVEEWTFSHKMRLPHKVGLPLGSGGGGDDGAGGGGGGQ